MSTLDACMSVTLGLDEVEELHLLLGQLEDWLLHASDETVAELGEFVEHDYYPSGGTACQVIDTLGRYCSKLAHRGHGQQR